MSNAGNATNATNAMNGTSGRSGVALVEPSLIRSSCRDRSRGSSPRRSVSHRQLDAMFRALKILHQPLLVLSLPLCIALFGCSLGASSGGVGDDATRGGQSAEAADSAIFRALLVATLERRRVPVRVDPRPLRDDPNLADISAEALAQVPRAMIDRRRLVLDRLGIAAANAVRDRECQSPVPVEPADAPEACPSPEEGDYLSVIFGLPRPGGPYWPRLGIDEREPGLRRGQWTVRAFQLVMTPRGAVWSAVENVLENSEGNGWSVVERRTVVAQ